MTEQRIVVPRRRRPATLPETAPTPPPEPASDTETAPIVLGKPRHALGEEHLLAADRTTPPERYDPDGAWSFTDLASAAKDRLDTPSRLDPYFDGLWGSGSGASWLTPDLARRQAEAGLGTLPAELDLDAEEALEAVFSRRTWFDRLALLGALFSWRTMTAEQAAAFVGSKYVANAKTHTPASLFGAGVLDLGVFSSGLANTDLAGRGTLYRAAKGDVFTDRLKDRLSWPEWIAVTGGQRWTPSSGFDRHNILGTELGLRLAEYADIGTILGERFATVDMLAGSGLGRESLAHDQRAGDLCAVREDGLRIVFEMTASSGPTFRQKAERWARLMAQHPLETSGLCVVFVIIQQPGYREGSKETKRLRSLTYRAIATACKRSPGSVRDRVAERMGVATWREWFPERGKVHEAFLALRVDRPTGRGSGLWEPCDMLDTREGIQSHGAAGRPFAPRNPEAMRAVLTNAALLGNTPHWLRERRDPPRLWQRLLADVGLDQPPTPTPTKPGFPGHPLGAAKGTAGDAGPPDRLRGLVRPG